MAKLKPDPITGSDLIDFLNQHSDFSFEIRVLNALIANGFTCEHGGTYDDPATDKPREFDIRATRVFGKRFLRLAVECKNLRGNFPLLISCLPRTEKEAFHEIVWSVDPVTNPLEPRTGLVARAFLPQSRNVRLNDEFTFYTRGEPVGKSCEQVGRTDKGEITATDSDVYAKWAQALSSAHDLTYLSCTDGNERTGDFALSLVFPVVVVPNERLWVTVFDADGNRVTDPEPANRCSYFVGRSYDHRSPSGGDSLTISHLEFVTLDGLASLIASICNSDYELSKAFPAEHIIRTLKSN